MVKTIHYCSECNYTTTRKFNIERHANLHENVKSKHGNNKNVTYSTGVPSSMYVGNDVAKAPTTITCSGNNIAPTIAHAPVCAPTFAPAPAPPPAFAPTPTLAPAPTFVPPPALAPAPSTDFVKNMQLEEYVYNEKDEKENLPIYMNKYIIPRINILNKVRENDNMGEYPGHVIYCICEGLWNMRWKYKKLMCESTKYELKSHLESIKKYIRLLSKKKLSMKKKRAIL